MIPAGIGLPSYVAIPVTSCSLWPDPQPTAIARRRTRPLACIVRPATWVSIVTDHLSAVAAGEGAVGGDADRLLKEPDRSVAEGEVRPAGVHAPHGDLVELGDQVGFAS